MLEEDEKTKYGTVKIPDNWIIRYFKGGKGACTHTNKVFEEFPDEPWYAHLADDIVPETPQWDIKLIQACIPDKVAYGDDSIDHTANCGNRYFPTHPFIGGSLVRRWGFITPPVSTHFGGDLWWFDAANQVVLPEVKLTHHHFSNHKAEYDNTYRNRPKSSKEKRNYYEFKEKHRHLLEPKLEVLCVKWGKKYDVAYVNNLYAMVSRNLSYRFDFICYTDDSTDIHKDVIVKKLPDGLDGWWNKLALFKDVSNKTKLYIDLDTVITGTLDAIGSYRGEFAALRDFLRPDGIGSGVMIWNGDHSDIWKDWLKKKKPTSFRSTIGDQAWIEIKRPDADRLQDLFNDEIVSYKLHCRGMPPNGAKMVCFHGKPRPHEVKKGWIKSFWNNDSSTISEPVFDKNLQSVNTEEREIYDNVRLNISRGLKEIQSSKPRNSAAVLVGGAPSIKDNYKEIIGKGDIFALNNTANWLMERNIRPQYQVIIDSREFNKRFVEPPHKRIKYLMASCVHPAVLDNLQCVDDVWLWHLDHEGLTDDLFDADTCLIGGGNTVLLRTISLAKAIGYNEFHIFGADSSFEDDHHAYEQKENDGKELVEVIAHGRKFKTHWWMVSQVKQMQIRVRQLNEQGCNFTFWGDGLMQWTMKHQREVLDDAI